jgi:cytochrome P450/NADPH-cytochrome P450 reductase
MHPFANQMAETLVESGKRANRSGLENHLRIWSEQRRQDNIAQMHKICDDIVAERRREPRPELKDLLNVMLNNKDPVTGKSLSDENIRYQMSTFLVRASTFPTILF